MTSLEHKIAKINAATADAISFLRDQSTTWTGEGAEMQVRSVLMALAATGWHVDKKDDTEEP